MLTVSDMAGWSKYYDLQPFGHIREDYRSAIVALVMASCHSKKQRSLTDFMFESPAAKRARLSVVQTDEEMKVAMNAYAARINGNNDR